MAIDLNTLPMNTYLHPESKTRQSLLPGRRRPNAVSLMPQLFLLSDIAGIPNLLLFLTTSFFEQHHGSCCRLLI